MSLTEAGAVFLDLHSVDRDDLDLSALRAAWSNWSWHRTTQESQRLAHCRDKRVVVSNKVVLDARLLRQLPQLELICIAATGTNNVDLPAAAEQGVVVTNVAGYCTSSVVQHLFALLLTLVTRLDDYRAGVRRGDWQESELFCLLDYPITELRDLTLGIVGYGTLGRSVAEVARAFGMRVRLAERVGGEGAATEPAEFARLPLHRLLSEVDVLSLHCPLTETTRGLIGARELDLLGSRGILLNTARGGLVDEQALADALRSGRLAGAGIDVLEREPPAFDNPLLQPDIPNLLVTPHTAWAGRSSRQRLIDEVAANILAFRSGEPRNRLV